MTTIIINHGSIMPESTKDISQTAAPATKPPQIPETLSDRELEVLKLIGLELLTAKSPGSSSFLKTRKIAYPLNTKQTCLRNRQQALFTPKGRD